LDSLQLTTPTDFLRIKSLLDRESQGSSSFILEAASLRLTRGSSWIWGIALNVVSAKIQPLRLIQPCRR